MSASRFTAQRRAHAEGSLNKVQNSNTILTPQSPYRGVLGCGPRNFTQIVYYKPRCSGPHFVCPTQPIPFVPEPSPELIFVVSGSVQTGTELVSYTSIHMYVNELGDVIYDQQNGGVVVQSTEPPTVEIVFVQSGSVVDGDTVYAYTSIHIHVNEFGNMIFEQLNGDVIVQSTSLFPEITLPPPEIIFMESGSIVDGDTVYSQDSIRMIVSEIGDVVLNQQSGSTLIFSTIV